MDSSRVSSFSRLLIVAVVFWGFVGMASVPVHVHASTVATVSQVTASAPTSNVRGRNLVVTDFVWQQRPIDSLLAGEVFTGFVLLLRNPNPRLFAEFPRVVITARDAEGRIIYSDEEVYYGVPPRQTIAVTGQIDTRRVPTEITARFISAEFMRSRSKASAYRPFRTQGTYFEQFDGDQLLVGGEVISPYAQQVREVNITAVLRTSDGRIVGAGDTTVSSLQRNQARPFLIDDSFSWSNEPASRMQTFVAPTGISGNPWLALARGR